MKEGTCSKRLKLCMTQSSSLIVVVVSDTITAMQHMTLCFTVGALYIVHNGKITRLHFNRIKCLPGCINAAYYKNNLSVEHSTCGGRG